MNEQFINSIELGEDVGIAQFKTLTNKNIFTIFKYNETKLADIIYNFNENYELKNGCGSIGFYLIELERNLEEEDYPKTIRQLGLSKKCIIQLKLDNFNYFC